MMRAPEIRSQRAFIEAVLAQVEEAKELVLPLLMVEEPDAPWTVASLRGLGAKLGVRGAGPDGSHEASPDAGPAAGPEASPESNPEASLEPGPEASEPVLREATELLLVFELPFLEEEDRLIAAGMSLANDAAGFEVATVDFERRFWDARFAEYQADPDRWSVHAKPVYDVCEVHRLDSATVRRAIREHGVATFEDLAPVLGTDRACVTCHAAVSRLLLHELRRMKAQAS
jgi:bacterioferritin-associated ferredoxin